MTQNLPELLSPIPLLVAILVFILCIILWIVYSHIVKINPHLAQDIIYTILWAWRIFICYWAFVFWVMSGIELEAELYDNHRDLHDQDEINIRTWIDTVACSKDKPINECHLIKPPEFVIKDMPKASLKDITFDL